MVALGAGNRSSGDSMDRCPHLIEPNLRYIVTHADSDAQTMSDDASGTGIGLKGMAVIKIMCIDDALRCQQQQQQQREAQAAIQREGE